MSVTSASSTSERNDHVDSSRHDTQVQKKDSGEVKAPEAKKPEENQVQTQQYRSTYTPAKPQLVALSAPSKPATTGSNTFRVGPGGTLVAQSTTPTTAAAAPAQVNGQTQMQRADKAFIVQFTDPKYNPHGPNSSSDCGPASEAMAMAYTGKMPPGLSKDQQVDYARAEMSPGRKSEFTYVKDANGNDVPQLHRPHEYTGGTMEEDGIRAAGGNPVEGHGWDQLDKALENGPVISNGKTDATWRSQFPERMGSGDVLHVNTILGKTPNGNYLVADPLHTGGPVEMTRDQLSKFYGPTGGEPSFVATNYGNPDTGTTTGGTTGTGGTPEPTPPTTAPALSYDGGTKYSPQVKELQDKLVKAGYLSASDMATGPGYYGNKTKAAVAKLQAEAGLPGDGTSVDAATQAALDKKIAGGTTGTGGTTPTGGTTTVDGVQLSAKDAELAKRIDTVLDGYKDSKMHGMGGVIVDAARKEHVPPELMMAQLAKESTFLRSDNTLSIANNNPGNLRNADWEKEFGAVPGRNDFAHFPSVEQGIRAYAHLMGSPDLPYRQFVDNRDYAGLVHKYAPSSDGNNEAQYAQQLRDWTQMFAQKIGVDSNWVNEG